ncbi:mucin-5B-like [Lissotriton helveticus]
MEKALWILLFGFTVCECQRQIAISPPVTTSECSTWGNYNFQTFDGSRFSFPGTCTYLFAKECTTTNSVFNIVVQRIIRDEANRIFFSATLDDVLIEVKETGITAQGQELTGSFSEKSVLVEQDCAYLIISSKLGVVLKWDYNDILLLELEDTFKDSTCGMCGNYDSNMDNDLTVNGIQLSARQFGNQQKISEPTERCPDVPTGGENGSPGGDQCVAQRAQCEAILYSFGSCDSVLPANDYLDICTSDICTCTKDPPVSCACGTLNLYSRRCVLAGGDPGQWRAADLCYRPCPDNRVYMERGSSCPDTCSNPVRSSVCGDQITDGCFCPSGMILDDIMNTGCIPVGNCPCNYKGKNFVSGDYYSTPCQTCYCSGGKWDCKSHPCSGFCMLEGGSHITTFDGKDFTFHGNCPYVISKSNDLAESYAVLGELYQCGESSTVTCLKNVLLVLKYKVVKVCFCGTVYVNDAIVELPFFDAEIIIFKTSTDYITVQSTLQIQMDIQLKPAMQLFLSVDSSYQEQLSGLCGNFNNQQADDLLTASGVVEDSASAFANSWKTQASCPDSTDTFIDPCSTSSNKEQYAKHWCSLLNGDVFAPCSLIVDATPYYKNCIYDTCNSESSEDALIAILSAYTKRCTDQGVVLPEWRSLITDPSANCPKSMVFSNAVRYCNTTCLSLTRWDSLCDMAKIPVQGCGCPEGTFLDSYDMCVLPDSCTCQYKNEIIFAGATFKDGSLTCKCIRGNIECTGNPSPIVCNYPMQFYDCASEGPNAVGTECQKSCTTQNAKCYSKQCVSGCVCPDGLLSDDNGGCITEDQCPCMRNGKAYEPGENTTVGCNTCTCMNRMWTCTDNPCTGRCSVYGNGHFLSFDGNKFDFTSNCDYILTQDFCPNNPNGGTFRIISEVTSCGSTTAVCSMRVRIKIETTEIRLLEGGIRMVRQNSAVLPFQLSVRGLYLVITMSNGVTVMWDQRTTLQVKLEASFMGIVCGLCGNFDGSASNDFTTLGQSLESNAQNFGNSWKVLNSCPNTVVSSPCSSNPYREVWAQRYCSIIRSDIFQACHVMVNPVPYYDLCVSDSCSCDSGGDCECFCTAVAAYAEACSQVGLCVDWRTPDICPTFCDYYNPEGECSWHYKPCGSPCLKTCTNPRELCTDSTYTLEGCYPECSGNKPYFDEDLMTCVSVMNCTTCTSGEMLCTDDLQDCLCCYGGKTYKLHEEMYHTGDGMNCVTVTCGPHGQIKRDYYFCGVTLPATTESTTVSPSTNTQPIDSTTRGSGGSISTTSHSDNNMSSTNGKNENTSTTSSKSGNLLTTERSTESSTESLSSRMPTTSIQQSTSTAAGTSKAPCFCIMPNGTQISQGSIINHFVDAENWCFTSICNTSCEAETSHGPCPTVTTPQTSLNISTTSATKVPTSTALVMESPPDSGNVVTSPPGSTPTNPSTTKTRPSSGDCSDLSPPRRFLESWDYGNCITAVCLGDGNRIKLIFSECVDQNPAPCPSNIPAIRIYQEDSCCYSYVCQSCVTLNGTMRAPGETWQEDCQDYTCNSDSLDISSVPHSCPPSTPVNCKEEGQVAKTQKLSTDTCCTETVCACDIEQCSTDILVCNPGFKLSVTFVPHSCCPNYTCVPKGVCVSFGMEYQPGAVVPSSTCEECKCTTTLDPLLKTNKILCNPMVCLKDCEPGYTYVDDVAQCCGVCKQTACVVSLASGVIMMAPNSSYQEPDNNCTLYKCIPSNGQLVTTTVEVSCPDFNPDNCLPGTIGISADGCCNTCMSSSQGCRMTREIMNITNDGCVTLQPIEVRSCEGACFSNYKFSQENGQTVLTCSCCHELQSHYEEITLFCADSNKTTPYKYTFIDQCGCTRSPCDY